MCLLFDFLSFPQIQTNIQAFTHASTGIYYSVSLHPAIDNFKHPCSPWIATYLTNLQWFNLARESNSTTISFALRIIPEKVAQAKKHHKKGHYRSIDRIDVFDYWITEFFLLLALQLYPTNSRLLIWNVEAVGLFAKIPFGWIGRIAEWGEETLAVRKSIRRKVVIDPLLSIRELATACYP